MATGITKTAKMACSFRTHSFRSSLFADGLASPCLHLAARHVRSPSTLNCSARVGQGLRLVSSQSKARSSDQLEVFRKDTSWHSNHPSINDCRRWSGISGDGGGDQSARSKQSLQGTFVTGGKWDPPTHSSTATGLSSSGSPWVPPSSTTTATTTSTWDSLKQQISSDLSDDESSQSNIQANLKKLDAISKVTKRKQAYSPFMLITQLPSTVMPDDIKRMASSEGSIKDIIYHRNQYMEFQNRATVVFRSATDAVEFITQKYGKFLGTHKLNMTLLDPYSNRDKRNIPPNISLQPLSGQLVLVSGLPASARPDNLRSEFRRFHLMDTTEAAIIPVPSRRYASTRQFLIRLSSRSEAFRFVRTYHNTFFQYAEFRKRCPIRASVIY